MIKTYRNVVQTMFLSFKTEKTDFSINAHFQDFFLSVATVAKRFTLKKNVYNTKVDFFPKGQNATQFFSVPCTTEIWEPFTYILIAWLVLWCRWSQFNKKSVKRKFGPKEKNGMQFVL